MLYYLNETQNYARKIEDLEEVVSEDIYKAIKSLHDEEVTEIAENMECVQYDKNVYECRLDETKSQLNESLNLVKELLDYIENSKRVNRNKILDYAKDLKNCIEIGIDL